MKNARPPLHGVQRDRAYFQPKEMTIRIVTSLLGDLDQAMSCDLRRPQRSYPSSRKIAKPPSSNTLPVMLAKL